MSDPNENRAGYKETKVGWIPDEWNLEKAGNVCEIQLGKMLSGKAKQGLNPAPYLANYNVRWGTFALDEVQQMDFNERERKKFLLEPGDLLVCEGGEIGRCAVWKGEIAPCYYQKALHRVRPNDGSVDVLFLMYYLHRSVKQPRMAHFIGESSIAHFTRENFLAFPIAIPPPSEQQEIAEILSTCDEALEKTGALIYAKKRQKKTLMQQLLTGKKRLPGFEGEWTEVRLQEICTRLTGVAENPDEYPVLSITAGTGFVSQADKFSRVIAGKQVERYVVLERGDFSYNKGNSYRYPQGCVYQLSEYDAGLVPNVFFSFRLDEQGADTEFIKQYFLAGLHNEDLYRWINSGVRNNGLLNLNAADFFKLPIGLPPIEEQQAIGSVLLSADVELSGLDRKLKALQQQKKSLMQKLLTGQVRVKV